MMWTDSIAKQYLQILHKLIFNQAKKNMHLFIPPPEYISIYVLTCKFETTSTKTSA
jgi:hypothetical protein